MNRFIHTDFDENELTELASEASQSSFSEYWDNEDDNYWLMYVDNNEEN